MNTPLQPWDIVPDSFPEDGYASDQLEFLLSYAILAPSNHNTQPWLFRINATDVEIFADRRRRLPVVDPHDRELTMSCGAALFNLRVAADYVDHAYRVEILPDPALPDLLARFHLGLHAPEGSAEVSLFQAITRRRTNRFAFRPDPVPAAILEALRSAAEAEGAWFESITADDTRNAVADLVSEADRKQWSDRHFRQELATWVRSKPESSFDGIPAHTLGIKDWLSFAGPSLVRTFDRGGGQAARDRDIAVHSPVLAVLGTDRDDVPSWMAAGQALERVLLLARSEDVWASFLGQPIEVPDLRGQLGGLLGRPGFPQALLRLGYGDDVVPTPRRPARDLLIRHRTTHG